MSARKGPRVPRSSRRAGTKQCKHANEWVVPALKVLAYLTWLAATLAGKGCGPS